jgi:PAS domain S-box-containing protein
MSRARFASIDSDRLGDLIERLEQAEEILTSPGGDQEHVVPGLLRQARSELLAGRAGWRLLLERLPLVIWTTDAQLCITSLRGSGLEALKLDPDQWLGLSLEEVLAHRPQAGAILEAHRRALAGETVSYQVEARGRTYQAALEPLRDGGGPAAGCLGVALDVTQQREDGAKLGQAGVGAETELEQLLQAHEELQVYAEELQVQEEELEQQNSELMAARREVEAERRRYRELFEFAPDGYLVTDPAGVIRQANRAAAALLGVSQEFLAGKPLAVYVSRQERAGWYQVLEELKGGKEHVQAQMRLRPRRGEAFPAVITLEPVRDPSGALAGLRCMLRDVSRQVRLEEERERLLGQVSGDRESLRDLASLLERERDTLQTIMESTPAHLALLDPDFNFIHVNAAYAASMGRSPQELRGRNHFDFFLDAAYRTIFEQVRDSGQAATLQSSPFDFPEQPAQGSNYWDWTLAPVKDEAGHVLGLVHSLLDVTQEVLARQRIEHLAAQDQAILHGIHDGLIMFDLAGNVLDMNPAALRMHGFEGVEQARRHLRDYPALFEVFDLEGDPLPVEGWPLARVLRGESFSGQELYVRRRDTGRAWYGSYGGLRVQDQAGKDILGLLTLRDISERVAAEAERARARQALGRYAERLSVLRQADQAILASSSAQEIADVTLPFVRRLVPCQRVSVTLFDFEAGQARVLAVQPEDDSGLGAGRHLPLGGAWPFETLAQGRIHVVEDLHAVPPASAKQAALAQSLASYVNVPLIAAGGLIGSLNLGWAEVVSPSPEQIDIAREVADELAIGIQQANLHQQVTRYADELEELVAARTAALRTSEARFRVMFEAAGLGVALDDLEGHILESNPALQEILGYTAEELRGRAYAEFTHPEDVTAERGLFGELVAGERERYRIAKRYLRNDGDLVWANLTVSLVRGDAGEPRFAIAMVEDISEQRRIQEALVRSEKLAVAGRLAASLAHEINNPLQSVLGCLGLAREGLEEGEGVERYLEVANEELGRMARIVAQLRDMARPLGTGERQPADVNALVEHLLTLNRERCRSHGVELIWQPQDDLPELHMVPDRIQQVFLNMLLNALDAMPDGGRLEIVARPTREPDGVQVSFRDSGLGIAPESLSHIFEPFYSTRSDGMGLGLFVSHNVVQDHGGHIQVDSQLGEGTTFTIWLPA